MEEAGEWHEIMLHIWNVCQEEGRERHWERQASTLMWKAQKNLAALFLTG